MANYMILKFYWNQTARETVLFFLLLFLAQK